MRTPTAQIFNTVTKKFNKVSDEKIEELTATAYEELYRGNAKLGIHPKRPAEEQNLQPIDPETSEPLTFRSSHYREGGEEFVRACWVRPKGYGDSDHIFNREPESLKEAIISGKSILLTINMKLASFPISFRNMRGHSASTPEKWIEDNKGSYITASVNSAKDAVLALKRIYTLAGEEKSITNRIFARHCGAVIPYRNFFIGSRNKIVNLYNDMKDGKGGISLGTTRFVGFPRLMSFIPTFPTIKNRALKRIQGNHAKVGSGDGKPCLTQLVFDRQDELRNTQEFQDLQKGIIGGSQAVYVLATPSMSLPVNDPMDWKHMRLNIGNIPAQTLILDPEAKEKLLRYRETEEQKWGEVLGRDSKSTKKGELIFPGNRPDEHYL